MRELMEQIDFHVELVGVEVSNNPRASDQSGEDTQFQPLVPNQQPPMTVAQTQPTDPTV